MTAIYADSQIDDAVRRARVYAGDIFVLSPTPSTLALVEHARAMIEAAFGPDPRRAQHLLAVEQFVALGAPLKPAFIHHPRTRQLIWSILEEHRVDLEHTYADVPRLRLATSDAYLTAGVGYAFHPHRDTWYSAPMCQLNWWMPIYEFASDAGMAIHPHYMSVPVRNGSRNFNYYRWNADGRKNAARHVTSDSRAQPKPEEPLELEPQVRVVCPPGAIVLFSAAHLHSTVPNTSGLTRFSIDFRTVHAGDLRAGLGAANLDSECSGTSLRDFVRGTDGERLPPEIIARFDDGSAGEGIAVFTPEVHDLPDDAGSPDAGARQGSASASDRKALVSAGGTGVISSPGRSQRGIAARSARV